MVKHTLHTLLRKKFLFILGIGFFLLGGIVLLFFLKEFHDTSDTSEVANAQVVITKDGFSPPVTTLTVGQKVAFMNNDTSAHWVASDNHPTHAIYPEFDARGAIGKGTSWTFQFTRSGSFTYHDHLHPSFKGKVVVLGSTTSQNTTLPKTEVAEKITHVIEAQGIDAGWDYLKTNYYTSTIVGLHDIAHYIGSLYYKKYGLSGIDKCDGSFAFGCYHGHLEEFIVDRGVDNLKEVVSYCDKYRFGIKITCYHGLGHGILSYLQYDLQKSLNLCDEILPKHFQTYCYTGVFMENGNTGVHTATKDNPLLPCTGVADRYKLSCYQYQMVSIFPVFNWDIRLSARACEKAEKQEYVNKCILGIAHHIAQANLAQPEVIKKECAQIENTKNMNYCIIKAAGQYMYQRQPYEKAKAYFCDDLPKQYFEECLSELNFQRNAFAKGEAQ